MAKQPGLDFQSAKGGLGELKRRLMFVIGALIVFRIGSFIPIPGIDAAVLAKLLEQQRGTIIEMFNMFSGGAARGETEFRQTTVQRHLTTFETTTYATTRTRVLTFVTTTAGFTEARTDTTTQTPDA